MPLVLLLLVSQLPRDLNSAGRRPRLQHGVARGRRCSPARPRLARLLALLVHGAQRLMYLCDGQPLKQMQTKCKLRAAFLGVRTVLVEATTRL